MNFTVNDTMRREIAWATMIFISLILNFGCKKSSQPYMATATIEGPDPRVPQCGGGTWINIDGHPNPNNPGTGYYDIGSLPQSFRLDNSVTYPIRVEIDYSVNPYCTISVDITRIQKIN